MIKCGDTHVMCTATVEEKVPMWLKNSGQGWITAEYGMLPRATGTRTDREAKKGQSGRTQEIQRLIGRALRAGINLKAIDGFCIKIDCDVIQADGGTRTASVTGGFVAMYLACQKLLNQGKIKTMPITQMIAAVSCGVVQEMPVLDLDYTEDSNAGTDSNFVMTDKDTYDVIVAHKGEENLINMYYQSFADERVKHLIVVDSKEQMTDFEFNNIFAYCIVSDDGQVTYYRNEG